MSADSHTQGAIDHGVGFWKIVAWTGLLLAGTLYMVDPLEPFSWSGAPICLLAAEYVEPGLFVESKANGATVGHDASATNDEQAAPLFGMETEPVTAGALLDKWRRVEAGITKELDVIVQCQAGNPCPAPASALIQCFEG